MSQGDNTQINRPFFEGGDIIRTYLGTDGVKTQGVFDATQFLVVQGKLPGYEAVRKFGNNSSIAATETYIGGSGGSSPYFPTAATIVEAISTSVNDDVGGTGATKIYIEGLNGSFNPINETIEMNGTSAVQSVNSYIRITQAYVVENGTYHGGNDGTITVRATGGGTTFVTIGLTSGTNIPLGNTRGSHYCVPAGYTLYINEFHFVVNTAKSINLYFWQAVNANDVTSPYSDGKRVIQSYEGVSGSQDFSYIPPLNFPEYTDLWFSGTASGGGGGCSVEYCGTLVLN